MSIQIRLILVVCAGCLFVGTTAALAADSASWRVFAFQAGAHYRYRVIDHDKKQQTEFNLGLERAAAGQLLANWSSVGAESSKHQAQSQYLPQQLVLRSRPLLMKWPLGAAINATLFSQWWEGFTGFALKPGARTMVGAADRLPLVAEVGGECRVLSLQGFNIQLTYGQQKLAEICVAADQPLPLSAKIYARQGRLRYEASRLE